jgi:hypothetical protein
VSVIAPFLIAATFKQTFVGKPTIHLLSFPCFVAGFDRKTVEHFSETCLAWWAFPFQWLSLQQRRCGD